MKKVWEPNMAYILPYDAERSAHPSGVRICHAMEEANAMKEILQLYTIQGIV